MREGANWATVYIGMATARVQVSREVLEWAVDYSRRGEYLFGKYPKLQDWLDGTVWPTVKQLRGFARDARVAEGWMYGTEPPDMKLDIPDMRTAGGVELADPSPDLIDTVFDCQIRQDWLIGYLESNGFDPLDFVGSCIVGDSPSSVAADMRQVLSFGDAARVAVRRETYRRVLVDKAESAGIYVMISGIVGNNTSRKLDPEEFRGFALSDSYAPVIFVNGNDSVGAQLFTIAHELAHVWLGNSAVSAPDGATDPAHAVEKWCNEVAAEFLVPSDEMVRLLGDGDPVASLDHVGRHFKVSDQVILRRLRSAGLVDASTFSHEYIRAALMSRTAKTRSHGGGDYYATLLNRVNRRFAERVYWDAISGGTLYRDALRMLDIRSVEALEKVGERLGLTS